MSNVLRAGAIGVVASLCVISPVLGGDLTPPAGAPSPTMKTLTQVEPRIPIGQSTTPGNGSNVFRITQPGSYYLVANVAGESGKNGISIEASNVTVDLSGFAVVGVTGSSMGIRVTALDADNVVVLNGSVSNWGSNGVDLFSTNGTGGRIDGVNVANCTGFGMRSCTGGIITRCTASDNSGNGIVGVSDSMVEHSTAHSNGAAGILCGTGSHVQACMVFENSSDGINVSADCSVIDCTSRGNGGDGIVTGTNATVSRCNTINNADDGILSTARARIDGCNSSDNSGDGIQVTSNSTITNCTAHANVGAGIRAFLDGNRIDMNHVNGNDKGVVCAAAGNVVTRNVAKGNTTAGFELAANNLNAQVMFFTTQFNDASPWVNISH